MARRRRGKIPEGLFTADIESLTHEGKGVAHIDDKVVFISGSLPGEQVSFKYTLRKKSFDEGVTVEVIRSSQDRVDPPCEHFSVCGGCSLQHMSAEAQLKNKHQILLDNLQRIGKVEAQELLPPMVSSPWGYRRRCRSGA